MRQKENWEFDWQRRWCQLYELPENKARVLEYWIKYRHLEDIQKIVPVDNETYILDVGCGISTVLHYLPGHRYGIDPLIERYKTIYAYPPELTLQAAYGESIPFPDSYFNLVICSNCIDHTLDPAITIAEIHRVLTSGGHFILTCEVFEANLGKRNAAHPYSMNVEKLMDLVSRFNIIASWNSPWIGLQRYILDQPPTEQREQIFLLSK